ncbi:MAG: transglycosylase SLT domain-containing protein, partial [Bacteroidales bacterium]|nr:transglycosylase SLT domain-containing protein [Bacteroidales bacterium]
DEEVDERYNIEKSTRAAAAYFRKGREEFGSWTLSAASYNIGMDNVRYRVKIQNENNYYDMQFPEETGRYLFRALAFKTIMNDPERYGFYIDKSRLFNELKYTEVEVNGAVENWSDFARQHGTNFKILKIYNQWIRANMLFNKAKRKYTVKLPAEGNR